MSTECILESCISADRASAAPVGSPVIADPAMPAAGRAELPCQAGDADLWFAENPRDLEQAKAMCEQCPLKQACLLAALERAEPWGVWGGEIFDRGVVVARKRPRGRPRKNAA